MINVASASKMMSLSWYGNQSPQFQLPAPIIASKIGVRKISTYNGFYNITATNNIFTYTSNVPAPNTVHTITIAPGIYSISTIQAAIRAGMEIIGESAIDIANFKINIYTPNAGTSITSPFAFDFTPANSINDVLGFDKAVYPLIGVLSFYLSQKAANITNNDYIYVQCSIMSNGYSVPTYNNAIQNQVLSSSIIYEFPVATAPGAAIQFSEAIPIYLPTGTNSVNSIQFTLVNKFLQQVSNPNQAFTISLEFI
jgi:hypothetical protein